MRLTGSHQGVEVTSSLDEFEKRQKQAVSAHQTIRLVVTFHKKGEGGQGNKMTRKRLSVCKGFQVV